MQAAPSAGRTNRLMRKGPSEPIYCSQPGFRMAGNVQRQIHFGFERLTTIPIEKQNFS
jgi:hypothetical protein